MDLDQLRMIGRALYYGVCVAAVLRGDRPLRLAGATIVAAAVLSPLAQRLHALDQPQYGVLVVDILGLTVLTVILLRDRRWWLIAATGFGLISTLTHVAALIGTPLSPYAVATARLLWSYAKVGAVGWGLFTYEREKRIFGSESAVRIMVAEQGEARARAELDRRYLVATNPAEKAKAARLVEALSRLSKGDPDRVR